MGQCLSLVAPRSWANVSYSSLRGREGSSTDNQCQLLVPLRSGGKVARTLKKHRKSWQPNHRYEQASTGELRKNKADSLFTQVMTESLR